MTDEARAGEPRTPAGRALYADFNMADYRRASILAGILAIEREATLARPDARPVHVITEEHRRIQEAAAAPALDVDRLAQAIHNVDPSTVPSSDDPTHSERQVGEQIAAEYARLSESANDR